MGDTITQTRSENVSKFSNDLLLAGVNIPRSSKDSLQLKELMEFCTKLQQRVLNLENTKTAQAHEITSLKKRVKKLERKKKSRTHGLKRLYKVGLSARIDSSDDEASLGDQEDASKQGRKIHDIDADEDITLENDHDANMFGVHDLDGDEVFVETKDPMVNAGTTTSIIPVSAAKDLSDVGMTLAQALAELKSTKPKAVTTVATTKTTAVTRPKAKGLVIQEQEQASTLITSSKDKGKRIMVEEPLKMKKKDQVLFDEQEAIRLQAQFNEEERIAREKEEANAALIAQWNGIQDKKRRKHFVAKRAEERRNRPPTKAQQRSIMYTYLKNLTGWKPKDLKTKSFVNVQELFEKAMKRVNTYVDMDTELVEGSETKEEENVVGSLYQDVVRSLPNDVVGMPHGKWLRVKERVEAKLDGVGTKFTWSGGQGFFLESKVVMEVIGIRAIGYREVVLFRTTGYSISEDPEEEKIEEKPLKEPMEE
ncbi:hypothetical protein Tco_1000552, partial [Tanacetum coccineum]